jgi:MFS family permease
LADVNGACQVHYWHDYGLPFLTIYASEKLLLPLAAVTSLMTFNSVSGFVSSVIAGSLVDRFGRKGMMVIGLFGMAIVYLGYMPAKEFWQFACSCCFQDLSTTLSGWNRRDRSRYDRT